MLNKLIAFMSKWAYCQRCCDRTDQQYEGPYWRCLSCKSKIDREGRVVK